MLVGLLGERVKEGRRTVHPELTVRVYIHVKLNSLAGCDAVEVGFQGFGFDAITG
jgi:hypothetical protein